MTHDQECKFDPKYCSSCKLQAEARVDEREKVAARVMAFLDAHENDAYYDTELIAAIHGEM